MKSSYLKIFLFALFVSFFILIPNSSKALEEHKPDSLSDIHKEIFGDDIKHTGFEYTFLKDILPEKHSKRVVRKPGKEFSFSFDNEVVNKVLRIKFAGESVYDHASIEDPILNITDSNGGKIAIKLNKPEIYISGLSKGKYNFLIKGVNMGYDYLFDIDLINWFFAGKVIYISNSFDFGEYSQKLDEYLEQHNDACVISSNTSFNSSHGLNLEEAKFSNQYNDQVIINLANTKDRIDTFSSNTRFDSIYEIDEGVLVAGKKVGYNTIIAISPDLTSLKVSSLKPVSSSIKDYYLKHKQSQLILKWLLALVVIFVISSWLFKKKFDYKIFLEKFWFKFNIWRRSNQKKILFVLVILLFLGVTFSIIYVFLDNFSLVKIMRNNLAGIYNKKAIFFWAIFILTLLAVIAYFESIWRYIINFVDRYRRIITYLLLAIFTFGAYNLIFYFYPAVNRRLVYFLVFLVILYFAGGKNNSNEDKSVFEKYYLIFIFGLIVLLAPIYFAWISQPYWHSKPWVKCNQLSISDSRVVGSYGFKLKNIKEKKLNIGNNNINIKGRQDFKLFPNLAGLKPDKVTVDVDSRSNQPLFIKAKSDAINKDYLVDYPGLAGYSKIPTNGELAIWLSKKYFDESKKSTIRNIEQFINILPKSLSVETDSDFIAGSSPLEQSKDDVINLSSFYKKRMNYSSKLNSYQLDIKLYDYSIYTYFENEIEIMIEKHDINKVLGSDQANLAIYGPKGDLVKAIELVDDNQPLGQEGRTKVHKINLSKDIREGVYNLRFYDFSDGDIIIDKISLNSPYFSFDNNHIPNSVDTSNFFQFDDKLSFKSPNKNSYFYPYDRAILKPGSSADVLIYRDPYKISQEFVGNLGDFIFSLFSYDKSKFILDRIKIDYHYLG